MVSVGHARSTLLSSLMGGVVLLAADILARWVMAPEELPVGVLTALLGGSYLLWLMHRSHAAGAGVDHAACNNTPQALPAHAAVALQAHDIAACIRASQCLHGVDVATAAQGVDQRLLAPMAPANPPC